jgi:DNA polymerase
MTDPRELVRRYLAQQLALGAPRVVLGPDATVPDPVAPPEDTHTSETRVSAGPDDDPRRPAPRPTRPRAAGHRSKRARQPWDTDLPAIPPPGIVIPTPAGDLFTADPRTDATFDELVKQIHACTRCALHASRTNAVPGEGPLDAKLVVVGEGPGANEDAQGRPFVGRAGDLLNEILAAIDCPRETVYIANVVKCRPPDNRKPLGEEVDACLPYLHRQLALIRPKVVLAMGATAAEALLQTRGSLGQLRNRVHEYRGIPLIVTYHPAALLRNPNWKRPTWDDVRIARQLLDR